MPGYNHYPSCTCGWCVKYRGSSSYPQYHAEEIRKYTDVYSAKRFLDQHNVNRAYVACFVSPNAKCPVCAASVFYYQNAYGSKVYFDDLGPPWPKHPCTDNSAYGRSSMVYPYRKPVMRPRGPRLDLLEAARTVYWDGGIHKPEDETQTVWELWVVTEITRSGHRNSVIASSIGDDEKEISFTFDSASKVIEANDFFFLKGDQISVFDLQKMKTRRYKIVKIGAGDHNDSKEN